MTAENRPSFEGLEVGEVVASRTVELNRDTLVRYAGASGDFNPIHYNDVVAESVGLPGVIAHGMLTMGTAASVVEEWSGPGNVVDYQTRFSRPIPVPNPGAATVAITAKVGALDAEARTARIDIAVEFDGQKVLGKAQAVVVCA
ncbi:MaoC/PaaZ C-terminal domain-containing protein [Demequina sp. SYSU T00039]|uniref:MaoC/PaaZ C-terminal domain-containing protein n=1 Tax=Demequina lignilytica TaxID=3051663 RepID=A0AAW7M8K0_9MICO|nr:MULTISPECIES: MaoC/PaaZ C-terminal domain-containing protein [unclassified Demequina]MDN4478072.1 MaoC/PaaZ C-terminal domain-containing protein [Demequina sp. SYSU T00039-1]MDN4488478.1 MaoC/PaaZ C-terminal domain-containing protein [Demequina sp. SYSU T00039]MDN4489975.1 MaoC/PaaZ C-terminal domain-containing protein [Demequina sp. SYSU T00068]